MMETWIRDFRYAFRSLGRSPLFVAVAATTLALGIGVNATIFTFVNAILLRPLPVENPEELVAVFTSLPEEAFSTSSYGDYLDLRDQSDLGTSLIGHAMSLASLQHGGQTEMVMGELVTGNYFSVLGVEAMRGRTLEPSDDVGAGSARVVLLAHGLWQRRFGADPDILGRVVRFNGQGYEVVGVAPENFPGLTPGLAADYWIAASHVDEIDAAGQINSIHNDPGRTLLERRGYRWMWIKGRLIDGMDSAGAEAQMATVMARLSQEHPVTNAGTGVVALPASKVRLHPDIDKVLGPASAVLLGAVGLVLLIVCANLANMLLSRAQGRQREIAIRLALGAGRSRLVRQLLAESLLISFLGGALALLVALGTSRLVMAYQMPLPFSLSLNMGLDARVIVFTGLLACAAATFFGLVPALQASRPDLVPALKQGSKSNDGAARFFSLKNVLVMVQVAFSLVLLVAGSLLARGLAAAQAIDLGLQPERVTALPIHLEMYGYDRERAGVFFRTVRDKVAALPGVESAAIAVRVPFDINMWNQDIFPAVRDFDPEAAGFSTDVTWVDPEYFETIGAPLLQGRSFAGSDLADSPRVAIVNAALARRHWNRVDVVGERLYSRGTDTAPYEIVGVVADYKVRTVGEAPRPFVHFARSQSSITNGFILARSTGKDAAELAGLVRLAALEMDPQLAFAKTTTLGDLMEVSLYPVRMGAVLLGAFGFLALILASVGLYGVIAYSVSRRDREIGVRMAMGARPRDVVELVLRGGMTLVLVGMAVGLAAAFGLSRFLSTLLYGVSAIDPIAFGGGALVLLAVALVANYLPALRAARLDPLAALRQD